MGTGAAYAGAVGCDALQYLKGMSTSHPTAPVPTYAAPVPTQCHEFSMKHFGRR